MNSSDDDIMWEDKLQLYILNAYLRHKGQAMLISEERFNVIGSQLQENWSTINSSWKRYITKDLMIEFDKVYKL